MNPRPLSQVSALVLPALLLLNGCATVGPPAQRQAAPNMPAESHAALAYLWSKYAAETRALYFQGFNVARDRLDVELAKSPTEPVAVVLDIDETILDNTPFERDMFLSGKGYNSAEWNKWVAQSSAGELPGARDFLCYAASKPNVEIYYISSRKAEMMEATLRNLQRWHFPRADTNHVFLEISRNASGAKVGKKEHRAKLKQRIILLLGDDLNDFSEVFEANDGRCRVCTVNDHWTEFGRRFIAFPNPMYGNWENIMYDRSKTEEQKSAIRQQWMRK